MTVNGNGQNIPEELRNLPRWLTWRLEERENKLTKVPYQISGKPASSTDPKTWTTFIEADSCADLFDGIGFTLGAPYVGVDLDKCRDADTGELDPWAREIIESLNSYTELSPSGTGVHIFVKGNLPAGRRKRSLPGPKDAQPAIEVYSTGRYFTVTGAHLAGTPETIRGVDDDELKAWHTKNLLTVEPGSTTTTTTAGKDTSLSGEEFKIVCEAWSKLGPSASDDVVRLELFRRAPQLRDKLNREDYLQRTIANAKARTFPEIAPKRAVVIECVRADQVKPTLREWLWGTGSPGGN